MAIPKRTAPRGVLHGPTVGVVHHQFIPDDALAETIEHWWSVRWQLPPGTRHEARTLPHPSVHVVVERGEATIAGVHRGRFGRVLEGTGAVFGVKFRPGAFRPLWGRPVWTLTDREVPFAEAVGTAAAADWAGEVDRAPTPDAQVQAATSFFRAHLPLPAPDAALLRRLVEAAATDRSITAVEALRDRSGMHLRELQRWFRDAVGISPKWMIRRYRLHEAVEALDHGKGSLADLVVRLGYADQAHFTRDFTAVVGVSPSRYAAQRR